ncbi:hypothetical protein CCAX7_54970 [Capsulimonas corticalis]|uniref:Uncharacterized protein n=1 Tax=Capsulimonas corticalis TaxID=2219043 RepID=A0A402D5T5_9BACT|nr:hypothetical protein [Capsulimonas corticalis]BDI33446.1 hypothetical protein CCAX7_54970 [Capsulimonas corticalis]
MDQLDLFADPAPDVATVNGWLKAPRLLPGAPPIPTLIKVAGDDHDYAPARFTLAGGCGLGRWPSRDACVLRPDGQRMTLYDAVNARLATLIR